MQSEPLHPAWKSCKKHTLQVSGTTVDPSNPHIGMITLRINCALCGCPGEVTVDVFDEDIEWKVYHNSAEAPSE